MNKQEREIERKLGEAILTAQDGSPERTEAVKHYLAFKKTKEEERKNMEAERLLDEKQTFEQNIASEKIRREVRESDRKLQLEEDKFKYEQLHDAEKAKEENDRKIKELASSEKMSKRQMIGQIVSAAIASLGAVLGIIVTYTCYDKQTTKALDFETGGTYTSTTTKSIIGANKPKFM